MRRFMPPYPTVFRQQMVELVHNGRTPAQLSREFGCSAQAISNWVAEAPHPQAETSPAETAIGSLTAAERNELNRLRRENARLQVERDILAKATAWFAAKTEKTSTPSTNS